MNTEPIKTECFAVIVGINDYSNGALSDLYFATLDASQVAQKLTTQPELEDDTNLDSTQIPSWDSDHIRVLVDGAATQVNILAAFEELSLMMDEDDIFLFYFAGHGSSDTDVMPIDETDGLD